MAMFLLSPNCMDNFRITQQIKLIPSQKYTVYSMVQHFTYLQSMIIFYYFNQPNQILELLVQWAKLLLEHNSYNKLQIHIH